MKIKDLIDIKTMKYKWDVIENLVDFSILKSTEQNPKWHSEGNVWNHVRLVCQEATKLCVGYDDLSKEIFLAAALFHDIGKGITTTFTKEKWHSYEHEIYGEKLTRTLLHDETFFVRECVCSLVRWHMEPLNITHSYWQLKPTKLINSFSHVIKIINLSYNTNSLKMLFDLKKCDILGSIPEDSNQTHYDLKCIETLENVAKTLNCYNKPSLALNYDFPVKENNKIDVHVMIGISGAGKSTTVEGILNLNKNKDIIVVSRDKARYELGFCAKGEKYIGTPEEEEQVTNYCKSLIEESAKLGKDIIIDDMNIKKKYRDNLKQTLKSFNVNYIYHYVEASSIEENIKRRKDEIPECIIRQMFNTIEWFYKDEYNKIYYHLT